MIRRNARLRREYLYQKSLEGKDRVEYEKKRQIRDALQSGKTIPTELKHEAENLNTELSYDDARTEKLPSHIDDEYAKAGIIDPKILITTSRNPSSRLGKFAKELRLVFPNSQSINRGNTVMKELVELCRNNDATDIVIVHEHRGQPDGLIVSHLPFGPTAYFGLSNCVLRHDLKEKMATMSEAFPHLIFENFNTTLGARVRTILKYLFPVPKTDSKRVMTFANRNDTISFRHHTFQKKSGKEFKKGIEGVELSEIGPRFELKLYQLKLGTLDMPEAQNEWVLRPYFNTAKKRKAL